MNPMAIAGAVQGLAGIAGGIIGSGRRKREQRAAQQEFNRNMAAYQNLDTSNLAANLENTFEDLTVNQQQANFQAQQQQQSFANTMDAMSGAAGGSGIAALAQSLAGAQTQAAQQASASIGMQEANNQQMAAQAAARNQALEVQGAEKARALNYDKTGTLLGMSQQRLGAANEARAQATESILGGVGKIAGAAAPGVSNVMADGDFLEGNTTKGINYYG